MHGSPFYLGGVAGVAGVLCLLGVVLLLRSRHVSRIDVGRNWRMGEYALTRSNFNLAPLHCIFFAASPHTNGSWQAKVSRGISQ